MGTSYTFYCEKCGHSFQSSGKLDWGFMAVVKPFKCKDCNDIVDVIVGELGEVLKYREQFRTLGDDFMKCSECEGHNLKPWNTGKKKCPKCDGKVSKSKDIGLIVMWD